MDIEKIFQLSPVFFIGFVLGMIFLYCLRKNNNKPRLQEIKPHYCTRNLPCACCEKNKVLFFPDKAYPCNSFYNKLDGKYSQLCKNVKCEYLHGRSNEPKSAFMEVLITLKRATKTIDLCVYLFTQTRLSQVLQDLKKRGVVIRMITDSAENGKKIGNKMAELREAGIEVKMNLQSNKALMHNKFVIIDNKILIFGSFNWTRHAILENDEAFIISTQRKIVHPFVGKFEKMWKELPSISNSSI